MARVIDPPDLVTTLGSIRDQLLRVPADHPTRAPFFAFVVTAAAMMADRATQPDDVAPQPDEAEDEDITTPEDTLRAAGIDVPRQAEYQRRFSTLLAGRAKASS
jgi:hypothetical protein